MNKTIIFGTTILFLSGCGGGSSDTEPTPVPPIVDETPTPTPTPDPGDEVAAPLFPPNLSVVSCSGLDFLSVSTAQSDASSADGFAADNVIDNKLDADGRWQTTDTGAVLTLDLGYRHEIKEFGAAWYEGNQSITTFDLEASEDGITYSTLLTAQASSGDRSSFERYDLVDTPARFVRVTSYGNNVDNTTAMLEAALFGCPLDVDTLPIETQSVDLSQFGLSADVPPGENFDLLSWALDTPEEDPSDGNSRRASETALNNGYESDEFFYTADDGGMVFRSTIFGAKTSANTSFTRSELREMLRRGDTSISTQGVNQNNWVLGYQPATPRQVGGRGGKLTATLKVDHVTTTGSNSHQGRLIIGQIHAEEDEPIRLYYKKFPNNDRGYIYFASELRGGDDLWIMVVGEEHPEADQDNQPIFSDNPEQGIALGEVFSYEIDQTDARIDVIVRRGDLNGPIIGHNYFDMTARNSQYDVTDEWMYFKAGVYSQNNTGEQDAANNGANSDYDQATFYALSNSHEVNTLIVDDTPSGGNPGNQFASITDTTSTDTGELRYELPAALAQGRLEVTFSRTDDDAGNTDGFISLYNSQNRNDNSILDLRVEDELFETRFPSQNIDRNNAQVTPGVFQTAIITWTYPGGDTASGQLPTISINIDGVQAIAPFEPVGSDPVGGVSNVSFRFGNNSGVFDSNANFSIDNIRVYSDTAGNTLVFEDDFESYSDGDNLRTVAGSVYTSATNEAVVDTEQ